MILLLMVVDIPQSFIIDEGLLNEIIGEVCVKIFEYYDVKKK